MDIINANSYNLKNLSKINILLGKNGCGKSIVLREVERELSTRKEDFGKTQYITPERSGSLIFDSSIDQELINNPDSIRTSRWVNQFHRFKQQSVSQYKKLLVLVLEEIEKDRSLPSFDIYIDKINALLDNIQIVRRNQKFQIININDEQPIEPEKISSGESELIALAIEYLIFSKECVVDKENILFLDEPDVHLHPDLQVKMMIFLEELVDKNNMKILIATHSTALLGVDDSDEISICFMSSGQKDLEFEKITKSYKKILPVFGAHPLSNVFNQRPILLIEGEDDERIWQWVIRKSEGAIKIYPCAAEGSGSLDELEKESIKIIKSVYDKGTGYSLRDRDGGTEEITDLGPIVRMKLSCRNSENLIIADETLSAMNIDWSKLQMVLDSWLNNKENLKHAQFKNVLEFKNSGYDRKNFNLKEIRNVLIYLTGTKTDWEIEVGEAIAKNIINAERDITKEHSIYNYLGQKLVSNILMSKK